NLFVSLCDLLQSLSKKIHCHYRLVTCVYPAGNEDVITAPYNVALATNELIRNASCVFPVNNQALTEICGRAKLGEAKDKTSRYFRDVNNIIVNMLLHLTSGARFPGSLNVDMNEIATNLVPFPGMHFLTSSVSPLSSITMKPPLPGCTTR
ncbi:Tubulin alpha-4 chain, partial [Gryllus bimaculatus]